MERTDNPELSRLILDHLADLYNIKKKREGIHLSTLIYCLTRSFFDQIAPVEPTDQEVMLFSLGYGLQDVLTPKEAETPVYEKDGITFSPDFVFDPNLRTTQVKTTAEAIEGGNPPVIDIGTIDLSNLPAPRLVEIKTTRMSSGKGDFPETWLEYMMGGCYMQGIKEYELSVLHMLGNYKPPFPEIKSYKLTFEKAELEENWEYLLKRRDIYTMSIDTNKPPQPFSYCKLWECKNCRYHLQCQAIEMVAKQGEGTNE